MNEPMPPPRPMIHNSRSMTDLRPMTGPRPGGGGGGHENGMGGLERPRFPSSHNLNRMPSREGFTQPQHPHPPAQQMRREAPPYPQMRSTSSHSAHSSTRSHGMVPRPLASPRLGPPQPGQLSPHPPLSPGSRPPGSPGSRPPGSPGSRPPGSPGTRPPGSPNSRPPTSPLPRLPSSPLLTPEQKVEIGGRLKVTYTANEADATKAEEEAKRNYANLNDEMVMARKFKNDNANEKRKLEVLMTSVWERLQELRVPWEEARSTLEALRSREREMALLKKEIDISFLQLSMAELARKKEVLEFFKRDLDEATAVFEKIDKEKKVLVEEDRAVKEKDGRRLKRFNGGLEGHDKRRFAMRSRLARACHYTIYHAKRAHNYRLERARILPPTDADSSAALKESLLALDQQMLRAEEYLKGPLDESTGERFWTMAAHRSWWVKAPEGPLGSPPSP